MLRLNSWWPTHESLLYVVVMPGVNEIDEFDYLQNTDQPQQHNDLRAIHIDLIVDDNVVVYVASCVYRLCISFRL